MILREHTLDNWIRDYELAGVTAEAEDALLNVDFEPPPNKAELQSWTKAELIAELIEVRTALGAFTEARHRAFAVFEDLVERVA